MHTDSEMSGGEASQHEGMAVDEALRALHRTHREATLLYQCEVEQDLLG